MVSKNVDEQLKVSKTPSSGNLDWSDVVELLEGSAQDFPLTLEQLQNYNEGYGKLDNGVKFALTFTRDLPGMSNMLDYVQDLVPKKLKNKVKKLTKRLENHCKTLQRITQQEGIEDTIYLNDFGQSKATEGNDEYMETEDKTSIL